MISNFKWKLQSLSKLTSYQIESELTHLGSELGPQINSNIIIQNFTLINYNFNMYKVKRTKKLSPTMFAI